MVDLESINPDNYATRTGGDSITSVPHSHSETGLDLNITEVIRDDGREITPNPGARSVQLTGQWDSALLRATVEPSRLAGIPDRGINARVGILIRCNETLYRRSTEYREPSAPEESVYKFEIELDHSKVRNRVRIQPAMVRADKGTVERYATEPGHRIAEGRPWTIQIDNKGAAAGGLSPETIPFEDEEYRDSDLLVDIDLFNDPPDIYVNSDYKNVVPILQYNKQAGEDARLRDVVDDLIKLSVYPRLLSHTMLTTPQEGDIEEAWKRQLIVKYKDCLYEDGISYEAAVERIRDDIDSDPRELSELVEKVRQAIETELDPGHDLDRMIRGVKQ